MLILFAGWLHVLLAPYTKVEESFNLHAIHDLLVHGFSTSVLQNFDHFVFPGVVPRSFIGSIVLSLITWVGAFLTNLFHPLQSKYELQILVRLTLSTINALGLFQLQRATRGRFGSKVSVMFMVVTCTQFHIPFWMGRTLPNMFAFYPVNVASALIIAKGGTIEQSHKRFNAAIAILTFTVVVFRSEVILLLIPLVLQGLYLRRTSFSSVIKTGLITGLLSLALTVSVDSYFWNQWPLWPEFSGIYFNVFEGKSSEWGTSPVYSYFAIHLPKLLLGALPLSAVGLIADARMRLLLFPYVIFVALLSCLGHKEWRFVVYVVPVWNVVAARGAIWLMSTRVTGKYKIVSHAFFKLVLLGVLGVNILATVLLTQASMANYPGGEALHTFNDIMERSSSREGGKEVTIHINNLAAQTGASLFLHEYDTPRSSLTHSSRFANIIYNKTENLVTPEDLNEFDWVICESPDRFKAEDDSGSRSRWTVQASIEGLQGVQLKALGERGVLRKIKVPEIVRERKLWLLTRERN